MRFFIFLYWQAAFVISGLYTSTSSTCSSPGGMNRDKTENLKLTPYSSGRLNVMLNGIFASSDV